MKYLTLDNWIADQDLDVGEPPSIRAGAEYSAYLTSIKGRLPSALRTLLDQYTIHDARLRLLEGDFERRRVSLRLGAADPTGREARDISLHYTRVTHVRSTADPDKGLPGPHGYGDLGYDEIELLDTGILEHRLLFSTGVELLIRFQEFQIEEHVP